jgi:vitamin B12 transporter
VNALLRLKLNEGFEYYVGYDMQEYGGRDEVLLIAPNKEKTQAFFGQIRTHDDWNAKLHLSAGLRYNTPSDAESSTIWTGTAKYDITPSLFVRGVIGTAFKLPTAEELYAVDPFERGDPNLKAERSKNLNLSIGGGMPAGSGAINWELVGFARDVTNLIDYVYDPVQDLDQISNVPGKVKVRGGQAVLSAQAGNGVSGRLSYTRNSSEGVDGEQIARIPKSVVQAGLQYAQPAGRFGAGLVVNHVGDVYATANSTLLNYGDYTVLDLSARYFLDDAKHHRLGVRLENAFDEEYGRPQTGRRDADNSAYAAMNVGTPRLWTMSYTFTY